MSESGCLIETARKLSESRLWTLQRNFYERQGVKAWNKGPVPHYITNNSFIAASYARVVRGLLTDLVRAGAVDARAPVHIVELGAGAGRFGFLFIKHLLDLLSRRDLGVQFRYVMTDLAAKNLEFWRGHERLQDLYARGLLDLARFDAERDREIVLEKSGTVLSAETVKNPLVVIGNYVFDTLTFDAFRVQRGVLQESRASLRSERVEEPDLEDPELLLRLKVEYEHVAVADDCYPDQPVWNAILADYRARLGDTSVAFPVGALRCLQNLLALSGGRLALLTADKAFNRMDELLWRGDPEPVKHGSFSLTANFEAMGRYFEAHEGLAMHTSTRQAGLEVAFFARVPEVALPETRLEFTEAIDTFGPIDFFTLRENLSMGETAPLKACLDVLRLSRWDHRTLCDLSDAMLAQLAKASDSLKREVRIMLTQVWEHYYPIGGTRDLPFVMGRFLYRLEHYREAMGFYRESLRLFGEDSMTHYNIALCHYYLREREAAVEHLERSLAIDPSNGFARNWRLQVESEMSESGVFFAADVSG